MECMSSNVETMKWWERIRELQRQKGWSDAELAKRSGVEYSNIAKYLQGKVEKPRGGAIEKIALALGTTEQSLLFGVAQSEKLSINDQSANAVAGKRVPFIFLKYLGQHQAGNDLMSVWDGEMYSVVDGDVSSHSIVTQVEDNSMLPDFQPGDKIVCDPNAEVEPGRYVLAKIEGQDKAVFRRYRLAKVSSDGMATIELKPLNEDYPTHVIDRDHPGHIIGRCTHLIKRI
jgi:SOS-response transcriptional repressor LexA